MRAVQVALNLGFLTPGEMGGIELYSRRLTEALAARMDVGLTIMLPRGAAADPGWHELGRVVALPVDPRRRRDWVLADQVHAPWVARRVGAAVLHSLASTGPVHGRVPRVVTVHDLHYRAEPSAHFGMRALGMRVLVPAAARFSRRIIVPSRATRDDLVHHLRVPVDKIDVVAEAVGHPVGQPRRTRQRVRADLDAGERPVLLTVSAKRPHKNLVRLLQALARVPLERRPVLVLPGYATPHEDELRSHASRLGVADCVRFLGWQSDEDLEDLYQAADVFVFPSLVEGFGLPVLEALARGIPVATSRRTSLAEVAGDAALFFDAENDSSIAEAIERLLTDRPLAERLAAAGPQRAASFTWEAAAAGTVASYERAVSG